MSLPPGKTGTHLDGIIAAEGNRLAAVAVSHQHRPDRDGLEWQGNRHAGGQYAAEWEELLDGEGRLVGVQLDLVRELNPSFWLWLHRFSNVRFDAHGGALIHFEEPSGDEHACGPFLPVDAYPSGDGNYLLYIPELFPPVA